jgi:hypothetical protein
MGNRDWNRTFFAVFTAFEAIVFRPAAANIDFIFT